MFSAHLPTHTRRSAALALAGFAAAGLAGGVAAQSTPGADDATPDAPRGEEEAVGEVLFTVAAAFAQRDTSFLAGLYTEDAEWINAFGDQATGEDEIIAKLDEVFAAEEVQAGEPVGEPTGSVRVLTPDVAVGWTYSEIEGQLFPDTNDVMPLRQTHSLVVLIKEDDTWRITAQVFMDENTPPA